MKSEKGICVDTVATDSAAARAGILPGDVILSVNAHPIRDVIDFLYQREAADLRIRYRRGTVAHTAVLSAGSEDLGLTFRPFSVKTCRNNCVFCFVKQLPKGLRKTLYVKDEDYRLSFLYGNYITLSNITDGERRRIVEQRLSPLYLSVHATDRELRNRMLGTPRGKDILKEIRFFASHKIRMHTQIVLCPGYNDGPALKRTISDLYRFHPYVSSIAVVPVGLTRHRKNSLRPVSAEDARDAIGLVSTFQKRFRKRHGEGFVYCSDEMYLQAHVPIPPVREYDALPQLENGVGMVALFQHQAKKLRIPGTPTSRKRFLTFTGVSFYPYLKRFADRTAERTGASITAIPIENALFGNSVTVTGLLTGRCVIDALRDHSRQHDVLIVPDVVLKDDEDIFLDDTSVHDLENELGLTTVIVDSSPRGFVTAVTQLSLPKP